MKASQHPSPNVESFTERREKPLRERMPQVSAWVDDLRAAFGDELINGQIKAGIRGEAVFFATEGGVELGTRDDRPGVDVSYDVRGDATVRRLP